MKESPIFIKTYETMVWVLQHTARFPKNQRFLMARRMEDAFLDFMERLNEAAGIKREEVKFLSEKATEHRGVQPRKAREKQAGTDF